MGQFTATFLICCGVGFLVWLSRRIAQSRVVLPESDVMPPIVDCTRRWDAPGFLPWKGEAR